MHNSFMLNYLNHHDINPNNETKNKWKIQWIKVRVISYCLACSISTLIFPTLQVIHVTPSSITASKHYYLRTPVRISPVKSEVIKLNFNFSSHLPNTVFSTLKSIRNLVFAKKKDTIRSALYRKENGK